MTEFNYLLAALAFGAVTTLVLNGGRWLLGMNAQVDQRFEQLQLSILPRSRQITNPWWKQLVFTHQKGLRFLPNVAQARGKLQLQLMHAGIYAPWAVSVVMVARVVSMIMPPVIGIIADQAGLLQQQRGLLAGSILGLAGMLVPGMLLGKMRSRRHAILSWSLPDFLDLLVACLEAGMSIEAAMQRVTEELQKAHPLLGGEMKAVQTQIDMGASPEIAIRNLAERTDLDSFRSLSTNIQQARRFGTGIADALRQHANGLRFQREQAAEERAQKASVQILMPTMLLIFPTIFVVLAGPAAIKLSEAFVQTPSDSSTSSSKKGTR